MRHRKISLRLRVAAAASAGALIIVTALGVFLSVAIAKNNLHYLDRQLDTSTRLLQLNIDVFKDNLGRIGDLGAFAVTIRDEKGVVAATTTRIPALPEGHRTIELLGHEYRVATARATLADGTPVSVSVAAPTASARTVTRTQQQRVWATGAVAVATASVLGWLLGGRAVSPLARLTRQVGTTPPTVDEQPTGARESDELKTAIRGMLDGIQEAQRETTAALESARAFAASAAHELRTPLTVMRTDLEVIGSGRLGDAEHRAVIADLLHTQARIEDSLQSLEHLAAGDLHREPLDPVDVLEIADEAASEAMRRHPGIVVEVFGADPLVVQGWAAGIRLIFDNAIINAIRHGGADRIHIEGWRDVGGRSILAIDDNGRGVDVAERTHVFDRFVRGTSATTPGSGLGLALIAQQSELHGGRCHFDDSPLGGARLLIELDC